MNNDKYDIVIIGGGVTGAALLYALASQSAGLKVALLEKAHSPGTVNSSSASNSQTLHTGDIETNYTLGNALVVKAKAEVLMKYVLGKKDPRLAQVCHKMVLGVGEKEVFELRERYLEFHSYYPDLEFIDGDEIARRESRVMEGRDPAVPVCALASKRGLMVNYQLLTEYFLADSVATNANVKISLNSSVSEIVDLGDSFSVRIGSDTISSKTVMVASGAYSLHFAHMLGYGKNFTMLPVAGSYFVTNRALSGKVYRVQAKGLPFAAVHGDPDITNPSITRFGPTTKPLPLMERHHYETMKDFFKIYRGNFFAGVMSLVSVVISRNLIAYVFRNLCFDIPVIGKFLFLKEVRDIIPSLSYGSLQLCKGAGGIRPQLVDVTTRDLVMGDATILGDRCIFNTTPSPGASVCLANGIDYAKRLLGMLDKNKT